MCGGLRTCNGDSFCPFRVPKRGEGPLTIRKSFPIRESVARVSKFSGLRRTRSVLGETRRSITQLCNIPRDFCDVGKDSKTVLTTISTTISGKKRVLITEGYRGTICRTVCLQRLDTACVCPRRSPGLKVGKKVSPNHIRVCLTRGPRVRTILVASPACSKVISSITEVTRVTRRCNIPLVISRTRKTRFQFSSCFPISTTRLNTSIIVGDIRGALPYLARAKIVRLYDSHIDQRGLGHFLKVCRDDDPSCVLVDDVSTYVSGLRHRKSRVFHIFARGLRGTHEHLSRYGCVQLIAPRTYRYREIFSFSESGVLLSAIGDSLGNQRLRGVLQERFRLRVRVRTRGCILTLTTINSATRNFRELYSTVRRVSHHRSLGCERRAIRGRPLGGKGVGRIVQVSRTVSTRDRQYPLSRYVKQASKRFTCLCPPKVPLVIPKRRVSKRFMGGIEECLRRNFRIRNLDSRADRAIYIIEGRVWREERVKGVFCVVKGDSSNGSDVCERLRKGRRLKLGQLMVCAAHPVQSKRRGKERCFFTSRGGLGRFQEGKGLVRTHACRAICKP